MRNRLIDGSWILCLSAWLLASAWAAKTGNADMFPRLGAILVGISVIYYAVLPNTVSVSQHWISTNLMLQKHCNQNALAALTALRNISVLASSVASAIEAKGEKAPDAIKILADPVTEANATDGAGMNLAGADYEAERTAKELSVASERVGELNELFRRAQAFFGAVGTINGVSGT